MDQLAYDEFILGHIRRPDLIALEKDLVVDENVNRWFPAGAFDDEAFLLENIDVDDEQLYANLKRFAGYANQLNPSTVSTSDNLTQGELVEGTAILVTPQFSVVDPLATQGDGVVTRDEVKGGISGKKIAVSVAGALVTVVVVGYATGLLQDWAASVYKDGGIFAEVLERLATAGSLRHWKNRKARVPIVDSSLHCTGSMSGAEIYNIIARDRIIINAKTGGVARVLDYDLKKAFVINTNDWVGDQYLIGVHQVSGDWYFYRPDSATTVTYRQVDAQTQALLELKNG